MDIFLGFLLVYTTHRPIVKHEEKSAVDRTHFNDPEFGSNISKYPVLSLKICDDNLIETFPLFSATNIFVFVRSRKQNHCVKIPLQY